MFFSTIGIILLSPIFIIIAILIKIDSKGTILYKQERIGKNGIPFFVLKFRTMIPNAFAKGALTVGSRDPRVTNVGYYLRKYKLDELPQLFNVLFWNGSQDETISSHIGRRIAAGKANRFEKKLCCVLKKIDGNHCQKSEGE